MKKTVLALCLVAMSGLALAQTPSAEDIQAIDADIATISAKLPMQIGEGVSWVKMNRNKNVIYSEYSIALAHQSAKTINAETKAKLKQAACETLEPTFAQGFAAQYRYVYQDKSKLEFKLDAKTCSK